jgi:4-carboxymuconolactone decarboxylase
MWSLLARVSVLVVFSSAAAWAASPLTDEQISEVCTLPALAGPALPDRMPAIPAANLTEDQKSAVTEFAKSRKEEGSGPVFGPYVDLLRSPEVLSSSVKLGTYLQFNSILVPKIRQFIMAITARQWSQEYMWSVHCPGALKAGLNPEIAKALADGRRPLKMEEDEEIVYDFLDELRRNQSVSDTTYDKARAKFGEQGIIEVLALHGYYTYLSMVLNSTRHPVSSNRKPGLPLFPH